MQRGRQGHHHGLRAHGRAHPGQGSPGGFGQQGGQGAGLLKYTVYSDGGSRGNPGKSAYAIVVTCDGKIVHKHAEFLGVHTNNYAEYRGLIAGITKVIELGGTEAEFVMDSQLVIRQMNGQYKVKSPDMKVLHDDAVTLAALIPKVTYRNVRRSEEMIPIADSLLNEEMDRH
ncbi:MAG: ribonuclease HI family protein [Candidatus Methanomethylophilaceae archaeon]|nr:ribonuclease HI family protein [Candidatus Methanomethylophilaceae archaeon]